MSDKFKIDNTKIEKIAEKFQARKEAVEVLHKAYNTFSPAFQGRFLAHVMRGTEVIVRKKLNNNRFIIICEPFKEGEFNPKQKQAVCCYYPPTTAIRSNQKTTSSFIINYNKDLPEKELRNHIAHEIGHLFLIILLKDKDKPLAGDSFNNRDEIISSIFGVFLMLEKNDFYENYDVSLRNHGDWQELLEFFHKNTRIP